jgi:hypothetical protein
MLPAWPTVGSNGSPGRTLVRLLGRVEQRLLCLQAAAVECQESLRQQQPGTGPDQVAWQRRKPPLNRNPFAAQVEQFVEVLLDQPRGPGHLPGGHRVPDRVIGQPMLLGPRGGIAMQLRHPAGLFGLQEGAEQVGEQVVVAPPAAHLIQRHQEQPRLFDLLQQRLAARPAGDRVTQLPDSRSSTEVSSRNVRTCSFWCSSTSSARKSST